MRTALVTGASTGIGLETARYLSRRGFRVFAGARKPEVLMSEENFTPVQLDVDSDESVRKCIGLVLLESDSIDLLVNNAGVTLSGAVEMMPLDPVRRMFETNFYGAVRMMQAVLPSMRERRSGTVVNVSSVAGRAVLGGHGFYCAARFALGAISEAVAIEMKPFGLKVAIVEPGVVMTPIWEKGEGLMPPGHPYERAMARLFRLFWAQIDGATLPEAVAKVIYEAVEEGAVKLRYPVGPDATAIIAARDRMTASEWTDLLAEPDDAKFLVRAEQAFGADLYNAPSLNARAMERH